MEMAMPVSPDLYLPESNDAENEYSENGYEDTRYVEVAEKLKESGAKCAMLQQMYGALLNKVIKTA